MAVVVKVFDIKIAELFNDAEPVGREASAINREIVAVATATAPARSGVLKVSHRNKGSLRAGPYRITGRVSNVADHAAFVHEGTYGPITPRTSPNLLLRPGNGFGFRSARSVNGQRANPWLARAGRTVLLRRGLL